MSAGAVLVNVCVLGGGVACLGLLCMSDELQRSENQRRKEQKRRRDIERSNRRLKQELRGGSGNLRRVSSTAARRTAQIITDQIRETLVELGPHKDWQGAFEAMDVDGNGDLTAAEFRKGVRSLTVR